MTPEETQVYEEMDEALRAEEQAESEYLAMLDEAERALEDEHRTCQYIAVDLDGRTIHGPGSYAEIERTVDKERRAFRRSIAAIGGGYLPRSIVRHDAPIARAWTHSTQWVEVRR